MRAPVSLPPAAHSLFRTAFVFLASLTALTAAEPQQWRPADAPLSTPWTSSVTPQNALAEHPRPQFQRERWMTLNGLWSYALEPVAFSPVQGMAPVESMTDAPMPREWQGSLLVPFAVDAPLSGVFKVLRPEQRLWYRRTFVLPPEWQGQRVLLHFEAVDWEAGVYLNGRRLGQHRGGYDPFTFELTSALKPGENELVVAVWDATDKQAQPVGKQILPEDRYGFRYQPTGGIWQPVWLEAVPATHLKGVTITPDLKGLTMRPTLEGSAAGLRFRAIVRSGTNVVADVAGDPGSALRVDIPSPHLWSPEDPFLYDVELQLARDGAVLDRVSSYAGLRTITLAPRKDGPPEIQLNGRPLVQFGPLDQGYWPDGILTPPSDAAMRYDLEYLKQVGCNMVRVHIKRHPARWYAHADRLGLLVWQDLVCTPKDRQTITPEVSANWQREAAGLMDSLMNHPSLITWVVFNESWGQHDTVPLTKWAAERDRSRLINSASGWTDHGAGDMLDVHDYQTFPSAPISGQGRAVVFGELGGHNLLIKGHLWNPAQKLGAASLPFDRATGRMNLADVADFAAKYPFYMENLRHFIWRAGYGAIVYTQITDVEHECNGWLTYDRKLSKLPAEQFRAIHQRLYQPISYRDLTSAGTARQAVKTTPKAKRPPSTPAPWPGAALAEDAWRPASATSIRDGSDGKHALLWEKAFAVPSAPANAVVEVRLRHANADGERAKDTLVGFGGRHLQRLHFQVWLDGQFLRTGEVSVEKGQGEGVTYLTLLPAETALLHPGQHRLQIDLFEPESTVSLQATVLAYE